MKDNSYQVSGYDMSQDFPFALWETYSDADLKSFSVATQSGLMPGMQKFFHATMSKYTGRGKTCGIAGPVTVALVCNRSAATLVQGAVTKWYTLGTITATAGSTSTLTHVAKFVANEQVGNFVYILDNASGAGGAPEAEVAQIIKNTADVLTFQPAMTVAVANNDTAEIFSTSQVIAAASGDSRPEVAGVVLAPDGIPDNYWGWVVQRGRVMTKIPGAITKNKSLITGAGIAVISSSDLADLTIGYSLTTVTVDLVSELAMAYIDVLSVIGTTA